MHKALPPEAKARILQLAAAGVRQVDIAAELGTTRSTVAGIIHREKMFAEKRTELQQNPTIEQAITPGFDFDRSLDIIAETLFGWFDVAMTDKPTKAGLQLADRFFLAYRAKKGQALVANNFTQIFINLPPEEQEAIIPKSAYWQRFLADLRERIEAMTVCPNCGRPISLEQIMEGSHGRSGPYRPDDDLPGQIIDLDGEHPGHEAEGVGAEAAEAAPDTVPGPGVPDEGLGGDPVPGAEEDDDELDEDEAWEDEG